MDLTDITTIKKLCRDFGILPSRKKGQNFLIDKNVLDKLINSAELKSTDTVLEVGPGFGTITQELLSRVKKVIAVESDKKMVSYLEDYFGHHKNLQIILADILKLSSSHFSLLTSRLKIVSNLPYCLTSRLLRNFFSSSVKPQALTLIIQRQVADRICAKPGGNMSLLSLSVQFYSQPEIIAYIKPQSFWPKPKVESAIIRIERIKGYLGSSKDIQAVDEKKFFRLARLGFSFRRKMLKNNLASGLRIRESEVKKTLESIGLNPKVRAQDLSVADWVKLTRALKPYGSMALYPSHLIS